MQKFLRKMNKNNSFEEIYEKIKSSEKIIMSLHSSPDGDSLGSCAAMKYFLENNLGKKVRLISYDELSKNIMDFGLRYGVEFGVDITDVDLNEFDLLLILDLGIPGRIGKNKKEYTLPEDIFSICIDHHPFVKKFTNMRYIDETAVSTCSIVMDFFRSLDIEIDKEIAQRLMLGVVTDSVFLTIYKSEKAIKEINYLMDKGASYYEIVQKVKFRTPLRLKKYFAINMSNFVINKEKKFGYSVIKWDEIKELDLNMSEIRLGIQALTDIEGLNVVFNLVETSEGIKGSFRSKNRIDIAKIIEPLGGGGHRDCAGLYLKDVSLEEAEKIVLDVVEKGLEGY